MPYQNIAYDYKEKCIHLWDDSRGYTSFPYEKYAYRIDPNGEYVTIDGNRVTKVTKWTDKDKNNGLIYESDIKPENRVLIDLYYNDDELPVNHRLCILDIEVSTEGGKSEAVDAWQPLTSFAFYDKSNDKSYVVIVDDGNRVKEFDNEHSALIAAKTEEDLLWMLLTFFKELRPTILTGWNIDYYDIPYVYNRITNVLGKDAADILSPIGQVRFDEYEGRYVISGMHCLDYMPLYKKFCMNEEPNYSLDAISFKELGKGKIQYDGNLDILLRDDVEKFIEYNLNDVMLIQELDDKLKYIDLAVSICHEGKVVYEDIYKSTRYIEGAILAYCKSKNIVVYNNKNKKNRGPKDAKADKFAGAYVKPPKAGRHVYVFDIDMSALYPSILMSLNASPETKIGKVTNWLKVKEYIWNFSQEPIAINLLCVDDMEIVFETAMHFRTFLDNNNLSIASNGVLFSLETKGIIPHLLDTWSIQREEYRALVKEHLKAGDQLNADKANIRQMAKKTMSNSLYGASGERTFRFYDLDIAEATTLTGRQVLIHAHDVTNIALNELIERA